VIRADRWPPLPHQISIRETTSAGPAALEAGNARIDSWERWESPKNPDRSPTPSASQSPDRSPRRGHQSETPHAPQLQSDQMRTGVPADSADPDIRSRWTPESPTPDSPGQTSRCDLPDGLGQLSRRPVEPCP